MSSEPVSSNWLSAGVRSTGHRSQPSPNLVSHSKQLRTFFGSGVVIACRAVPDGVNLRQKGSVNLTDPFVLRPGLFRIRRVNGPKCARNGFGSTLFELYSPFPRLPFIFLP
jgi:hypothetical protein